MIHNKKFNMVCFKIFKVTQEKGRFSIEVISENQLVRLMIINKEILMRNRNGNRFHSHQSTANLKSRTQSTTIPKFARHKVLYIYKKREMCGIADSFQVDVDRLKKRIYIRYIDTNNAY